VTSLFGFLIFFVFYEPFYIALLDSFFTFELVAIVLWLAYY